MYFDIFDIFLGISNQCSDGEYRNYINIIDDEISDDDPQLQTVIEESMTEADISNESQNVQELLTVFQSTNISSSESTSLNGNITISRKSVFSSTQRAIERKRFTFFKPVIVAFAGEEAVDDGGPTREFFRLLMREISESSIFHGSWFSHDLGLLTSSRYELAGKLVAWSILHGGSGPRCLSSVGYDLQQSVQISLADGVNAINDVDMKRMLQEFMTCSSEDTFTSLVNQHGEKIAEFGYPKIFCCNLSNKNEMIMSLLKQHFVYGVHAEVQQFFGGLNSIGQLGDMILRNKQLFDLILGNQHPSLTKSSFMALYQLNRSEEGSNQRSREDSTIYCFELFLQDLEEDDVAGLSLEDLLVFITGADCVPPLGFDKKITVDFYNFEENSRRRPYVSTCGLHFFLPRGFEDPEEFSKFMGEALLECHGFGKL